MLVIYLKTQNIQVTLKKATVNQDEEMLIKANLTNIS